MAQDIAEIREQVKDFVMKEFLPGEDPEALTSDTPLISGGILDSIKNVKLVSFLEESYGISFDAHEISADYLDSLDLIAETVQNKLKEK